MSIFLFNSSAYMSIFLLHVVLESLRCLIVAVKIQDF